MSDKVQNLKFVLLGQDQSASKTLESAGAAGEKATGRIAGAFSKLGGMIGGEVGELVDKVGEGFEKFGESGAKLGTKVTAAGGAIGGLGLAMQAMGSKGKAAEDQLKQSIENSGKSYSDFKEEIEKTIKSQENFGHTSVDTERALQVLTQATGDPKRAIENMTLVANLAAAKHIDLADAASLVAKTMNGSTKTLAQFGITMQSQKVAAENLVRATTSHSKAVDALKKAQQGLTDLEAKQLDSSKLSLAQQMALAAAKQKVVDLEKADAGSKSLTAAQSKALADAQKHLTDLMEIDTAKTVPSVAAQIALRDAKSKVATAQDKVSTSAKTLTAAQKNAASAAGSNQKALDELGQKVQGQAAAKVDNFSGRIEVAKTKLVDWTDRISNDTGPAISYLGGALGLVGSAMDIGLLPSIGKGIVAMWSYAGNVVAAAGTVVAGIGSMIAAGAVWAAEMAVDAAVAMLPFLPWVLLIGGIALAGYEMVKHWHEIWGEIKKVGIDVWHWAEDLFHNKWVQGLLWIVAPLLQLGLHWRQVWADVKVIGADAWHFLNQYVFAPVGAAAGAVGSAFSKMVGFVAGMPGRIRNAASGMWNGVKDAFRGVMNWIISGWDSLSFSINIPRIHIPGTNENIGGGSIGFGVPQIPLLANGGIVPATPGGRLVRVAEAGKAEAVIPLPSGMRNLSGAAAQQIHLHLGVIYGNADNVAHEILGALQRLKGNGTQLGLA